MQLYADNISKILTRIMLSKENNPNWLQQWWWRGQWREEEEQHISHLQWTGLEHQENQTFFWVEPEKELKRFRTTSFHFLTDGWDVCKFNF